MVLKLRNIIFLFSPQSVYGGEELTKKQTQIP